MWQFTVNNKNLRLWLKFIHANLKESNAIYMDESDDLTIESKKIKYDSVLWSTNISSAAQNQFFATIIESEIVVIIFTFSMRCFLVL